MMMITSSPDISTNDSINNATTTNNYTAWKLYDNPYYISKLSYCHSQDHKHLHHLQFQQHTNCFRDITFFRPVTMDYEIEHVRTQIVELKTELENERKARKKAESMSRKLARELAEERRGREALERVCEELARQAANNQSEADRIKRELEEERKMMRMAQVLREERVQMKLAEARLFLEEKLSQFEHVKGTDPEDLSTKFGRLVLGKKCFSNESNYGTSVALMTNQRRASPEIENPHISRGIRGFVEFPRVVRCIESRNRNWGSKMECQKAQLRILLKHKTHIRSNTLIFS